ncbi:hypothetical protein [Arthrobacter sp. AOP36-C1-22]|uniref:hypothetical protein n=1 Tax=Arthrobacter sp. AOP36-C1-22 TaxID=3457683 RepID=UPI004033AB0C
MATKEATTKSRDRTGIVWFVLGLVIIAIYGTSAVLVQNPFVDQTHTSLWLGVIIGLVMVVFGLIGMAKRRHPGHY